MRRSRSITIGLLVAAPAACSGGDDSADTPATSGPAAATVPATTEAPTPTTVAVTAPTTTIAQLTVPTAAPVTTFPPPVAEEGSVRAVIAARPELSNFSAAIDAWLADSPGREGVLRNQRGITVFAPDNDAFTEADVVAAASDHDAFTIFLSEHLKVGALSTDDFDGFVSTAMGSVFEVTATTIGDRTIVEADLEATNGFVHVIDGPLRPLIP